MNGTVNSSTGGQGDGRPHGPTAVAAVAVAAVADRSASPVPARPAPFTTTASITTFGTLAWLGWVWLLSALGYGISLTVIAFVHERDSSLWEGIARWQNWPIFAAGISMVPTFARLLVTNGVTRARMASSAIATMVVLGVLGALFVTAGFTVDSLVFAGQDWPRVLAAGRPFDGVAAPIELGVVHGLRFAAWFVAGWLVGMAHHQLGPGLVVCLVPALIPAAAAEFLLRDGLDIGFLGDWGLPLAVGLPVVAAIVAVSAFTAHRLTRLVSLR